MINAIEEGDNGQDEDEDEEDDEDDEDGGGDDAQRGAMPSVELRVFTPLRWHNCV